MIRRPPRSTLFPTRRSSDLDPEPGRNRHRERHRVPRGAALQGGDEAAGPGPLRGSLRLRSEEHTSELQSLRHLVCRLLLEKKKKTETGQQPKTQYDKR